MVPNKQDEPSASPVVDQGERGGAERFRRRICDNDRPSEFLRLSAGQAGEEMRAPSTKRALCLLKQSPGGKAIMGDRIIPASR
jgi:hypothetical protein